MKLIAVQLKSFDLGMVESVNNECAFGADNCNWAVVEGCINFWMASPISSVS